MAALQRWRAGTCSSLAENDVELTETPMGSRVWSSKRVGSPPTVRRSQMMLMSGQPSSCAPHSTFLPGAAGAER